MSYTPTPTAPFGDLEQAQRYLQDQLQLISQEFTSPNENVLMQVLHAAPIRPREGMVAYADGSDWNPGGGEGVYQFDGVSWVQFVRTPLTLVLNVPGAIPLRLQTTDDSNISAPNILFERFSSSPAGGDTIGGYQYKGNNSTGGLILYGQMLVSITDPTAGSEDSRHDFYLQKNGVLTLVFSITPTGTVFPDNSPFAVEGDSLFSNDLQVNGNLIYVTLPPNTNDSRVASSAYVQAELVAYAGDTVTFTNKTLTSPVINTPTGIVKGDVGLGNVDNTSDGTKNAAVVSLTNKTINLSSNMLSGTFAQFNTALSDADLTPLDSPVFTGVPAAPTASVGTDTTQIATTAFVEARGQSNVVNATYDLSTASGTQDITGFSFDPKSVFITFGKYATPGNGNGFANPTGGAQGCTSVDTTNGANSYASASNAIFLFDIGGGNGVSGVVSSISDGIRITWTKIGSPTGTLYITVMGLN